MSSIIFEGNTYTFGATVSANPGTGTTSYVFGGLSSGWTYGFIIWAFNGVGPSSIVGPIIKNTLFESIGEERPQIQALAWAWLVPPRGPYQSSTMYSAYGVTSGPDSGNSINYYTSSENLGNTSWFSFTYTKPSWLEIISDVTDPFGGTGAYIFRGSPPSSSTFRLQQELGGMPPGKTYIVSFYVNLDGNTGPNWTVSNQWFGGYGPFRGISMQQILPIGATASTATISPTVIFPSGLSGWQRFAWRMYAPLILDETALNFFTNVSGLTWENMRSTIIERTFSSGVTTNIYLYGPQLEIET